MYMLIFYLSLIDTDEDKTKFEQLYHRYKQMMYGVALRMTGNPCDAEDAVHDSFIKVLRHLSKIEEVSSHKTAAFLVIILRNTVLDLLAKKNREALCTMEDVPEYKTGRCDVSEHMEHMTLVETLRSLSERSRDVLELKALYQLSNGEIADFLDISQAAVRKRLERARNELRNALERSDDE